MNAETKEALKELDATYKPPEAKDDAKTAGDDEAEAGSSKKRKLDKFNAAHYSEGKVAASFTSTAMGRETKHVAAVLEDDVVR